MLYFAYGSNLNKAHMRRRCRDAKTVGKFYLRDARLIFRGVADVILAPGEKCPGAVYKLSPRDVRELDHYEGIAGGLYRKVFIPIAVKDHPDETDLMLYQMNSTGVMPPSIRYLETIKQGYTDFGLPHDYLAEAVKAAWDDKDKTYAERARLYRDGYAPRARAETAIAAANRQRGHRKQKGLKLGELK